MRVANRFSTNRFKILAVFGGVREALGRRRVVFGVRKHLGGREIQGHGNRLRLGIDLDVVDYGPQDAGCVHELRPLPNLPEELLKVAEDVYILTFLDQGLLLCRTLIQFLLKPSPISLNLLHFGLDALDAYYPGGDGID